MAMQSEAEGLEDAARDADHRFTEAIRSGDPLAASSGYARDARLLAPSAALIEGRPGIESFWRAGLDAGIRAVELEPVRVEARGEGAIEIGRYEIRLETPAGSVVDRGTYVHVLEAGPDGHWAWSLETF